MPSISEMKDSKFLKKDHVGRAGKTFTIKGCAQHNVAPDDKPVEMKWCLELTETDKPMVMNSTNLDLAALALGSNNTDDWIGKKITLVEDPTIAFGGKLVGGIRVKVN